MTNGFVVKSVCRHPLRCLKSTLIFLTVAVVVVWVLSSQRKIVTGRKYVQ